MNEESLRVLVIGAHPDDCDLKAGGVASKYVLQGHTVCFVSMTDGTAGHHEQGGATLARRRRREMEAAANVTGIEYRILDAEDGRLRPTLSNRKTVIRLIREFDPTLVLTHRPNDYHPDHRYTSQLVQDGAYMVTVPNICPDAPALEINPVIAYLSDEFQKPAPFSPDVVVSVDDVVDQKLEMLSCHESQMYEWLPFNAGLQEEVPASPEARKQWLQSGTLPQMAARERIAERYRDRLQERYGDEEGMNVTYAEAFEGCEYGRPLTDENVNRLFPFA